MTKIVLAYDKSTFSDEDEDLLGAIAPYVDIIKVGLQAMTADYHPEVYPGVTVANIVSAHAGGQLDLSTMWDMKLHDIGNTVEKAVQNILRFRPHVSMLTLHASMSDEGLQKAAIACGEAVLPLAVTVLTDLDEQCVSRYGDVPNETVYRFASNARTQGIRGLVHSPKELTFLRERGALEGMTTVIPGIRPRWAVANDQKRVMTAADAARAGADYIVVGRPILDPPPGITPEEAATRIREEVDEALASRKHGETP